MDEFELIRRYFARQPDAPPVVTGIGDDGAVLALHANAETVIVIDTLVEGVHFPSGMRPADIGYRAVAVNLSDLAAMGARPHWMTLALTLHDADPDWVANFAEGLFEAAAEWNVQLVGGDTTRGGQCVVTVQMAGEVGTGRALLRSGARPGDTIFVTGTVGDAAAGLQLSVGATRDEFLESRFARPSARVATGLELGGIANAAIDLSDGLAADLCKLLQASGVGAEVDLDKVPLSDALLARHDREQALGFALAGGDDYELCFTVAASRIPGKGFDGATAIGRVTESGGLVCRAGGIVVPVDDSGYRHFR